MEKIKFGTDGWRAVIAQDFTVENVAKVSLAISTWLLRRFQEPVVVVGHDCRFGGELFAKTVAKVLALKGIKVKLAPDFVSTPMVSNGVVLLGASLGIVITASHNPADYNGLKVKGSYGGPLFDVDLKNIEDLISDDNEISLDSINWEEQLERGIIEFVDLEDIYAKHIRQSFDLSIIKNADLKLAFDAMFGSGQRSLKKILPKVKCHNCYVDPYFNGIPPEPLLHNLIDFSEKIRKSWKVDAGLAVDGDADRIAMFDAEGNYIDSHHIMLLLIHYLAGFKKLKGKIVTGFSSTVKIEKLAEHYGLDVQRVKIGFKQIAEIMLKEDVLVGGEESGGISIGGNIPERDGIWMGLTIWQFMAESGKSIRELIEEIYKITGSFAYARQDLKIDRELKTRVIRKCKEGGFTHFGEFKVEKVETLDGWKYFFNDSEWFMIRPSGTEPLLRTYAEAENEEKVQELLSKGYETLMNI